MRVLARIYGKEGLEAWIKWESICLEVQDPDFKHLINQKIIHQ
jgi:hypothetical protein